MGDFCEEQSLQMIEGAIFKRSIVFFKKWFWQFLEVQNSLWFQVISNIYGQHNNKCNTNSMNSTPHSILGKLYVKFSTSFAILISWLIMDYGSNYGWYINFVKSQGYSFYSFIHSFVSWKFDVWRNLKNPETNDLSSL